jgi:hypothetical protein
MAAGACVPATAVGAAGAGADGASGAGRDGGGVDCAASGAPVGGTMFCVASNTSEHWPQRTQPSDTRIWSGTTLNMVSHVGQRVIRLMAQSL